MAFKGPVGGMLPDFTSPYKTLLEGACKLIYPPLVMEL
jgi:hypothetical protein